MTAAETDAERRDAWVALANERGQVIQELVAALRAVTDWIADEDDNREGELRIREATCNDCTGGITPVNLDRGLCVYHRARAAISRGEKA